MAGHAASPASPGTDWHGLAHGDWASGYYRGAVMRATASDACIRRYPLSRAEYDRAVEGGAFEPEAKVELVDGELHAMTPEGSRHAVGMNVVADRLRRVFDIGFHVRVQNPLALDDYSEPEPDIAVVKGAMRDYRDAHPASPVLVVEVSDDSVRYDRKVKQRLYARARIPEYWILAVRDARLEVYREPGEDGYQSVTRLGAGETVAPLKRPDAGIAVDDLLP